jgi:hypothetical protein
MKVVAALFLAAACGATVAHGAETDPSQKSACPQPEFPVRSSSMESVRLVEKALREWRACFRIAAAQRPAVDDMVAFARDYKQVKDRHEAWVRETVAHGSGQPYARLAANRVEREFWENLMADRGYAGKAQPARQAEAMVNQTSGSN